MEGNRRFMVFSTLVFHVTCDVLCVSVLSFLFSQSCKDLLSVFHVSVESQDRSRPWFLFCSKH